MALINGVMSNRNLDTWKFKWASGYYNAKKVYLEYLGCPEKAPKPFQWIWKSGCLPKQKFFFWLLLLERLNARDLLTRKSFYIESTVCVLCDDEPNEYMKHLFFSCDFSQNFWLSIGFQWNTDLSCNDMLIEARNRTQIQPFKECLIAGCWTIWKHRNSIIFYNKERDLSYCISCFKEHFGTIMKRVKPSLKEGMQSWLDYL